MQNNSKISEMLREIMRYSASHQAHDCDGADVSLRQSLKNLQARKDNSHISVVIINTALKCLDEHAWLQIQAQEQKSKLFFLAHDAENCKEPAEREELMIEVLVQSKLLGHIAIASNRMSEGVREYLLKAITFVTAQSNQNQADDITEDSTAVLQLQALNDTITAAHEKLAACVHLADGAFPALESSQPITADNYDSVVCRRALTACFTFADKLLNRATSLGEVALNTMPMFFNLSQGNAVVQKQWLLAYALTAATIADACDSMAQAALISCTSNE